jgi:hypothetical protein
MTASSRRTLLNKAFDLSLLLSPRSWLASPCMGAYSPGIDIREGGAILEVVMEDDDNNLSTECPIGGDIIKSDATEGIPPLPPVELKGFQHYTSQQRQCLVYKCLWHTRQLENMVSGAMTMQGDVIKKTEKYTTWRKSYHHCINR